MMFLSTENLTLTDKFPPVHQISTGRWRRNAPLQNSLCVLYVDRRSAAQLPVPKFLASTKVAGRDRLLIPYNIFGSEPRSSHMHGVITYRHHTIFLPKYIQNTVKIQEHIEHYCSVNWGHGFDLVSWATAHGVDPRAQYDDGSGSGLYEQTASTWYSGFNAVLSIVSWEVLGPK